VPIFIKSAVPGLSKRTASILQVALFAVVAGLATLPRAGESEATVVAAQPQPAATPPAVAPQEASIAFSTIEVVVNRNDTQQRIARAVARMWKQNLNIDTEIIAKDATDIPAVRASGDFDLIRKGIVFPTADPQTNVASVLSGIPVTEQPHPSFGSRQNPPAEANASPHTGTEEAHQPPGDKTTAEHRSAEKPLPTEEDALYDLPAIPLYFPTSYSLVKPYVHGFEPNGLDLFLLDQISIDNSWQPKAATSES